MNTKAIKIQKWWRLKRFKERIKVYRNSIGIIQAKWKSILIRKVYLKVLKSARIIQKSLRKHFSKKRYIVNQW